MLIYEVRKSLHFVFIYILHNIPTFLQPSCMIASGTAGKTDKILTIHLPFSGWKTFGHLTCDDDLDEVPVLQLVLIC